MFVSPAGMGTVDSEVRDGYLPFQGELKASLEENESLPPNVALDNFAVKLFTYL